MNEITNQRLREQVVIFLDKLGVDTSHHRFTTDNIMIRCPFAKISGHKHDIDTQPSLGLKMTAKGFVWHCFTCSRKGKDLISLIDQLRKDKLIVRKGNGYEIQNSIRLEFPDYYENYIRAKKDNITDLTGYSTTASKLFTYNIERRKLKKQIIKKMELMYDKKTNQVIFPCYDKDKILRGYVEHNTDGSFPKYKNMVDPDNLLYLEWLAKGKIAIIAEGMYDAIKVYQHLYRLDLLDTYSACGTFGSEISQGQISKICAMFDRVILMGDNDIAGIKMENKIVRMARKKIPLIYRLEYTGHDADKVSFKQFREIINKPVLCLPNFKKF